MMNNLIESIGEQLNIPKSDGGDWVCRVVYSIAGQLALASLWDRSEDEASVSIQHFKSRITQIFEAYEDIDTKVKHKVCNHVQHMKKSELQQALLQLLFSGPEWQYDRFVRENGLDNDW